MDRSWLSAWISRNLAPPVERWLPASWSANVVTGVGAGLMWLFLLGIIVTPAGWREHLAPLWVLLLASYCVLDHVDGCRARRRGTSSAWGEFLDHGLDAWHGPMMVVAVAIISGAAVRPGVTALVLLGTGLATAATWLEQRCRGEFFLGRVGPVEAVLVAGVYLATWILPDAAVWWSAPVSEGIALSRAEVLLAIGTVGALWAAGTAIARAPGCAGTLAVFAGSALMMVAAGQMGAPPPVVFAALGLATAEFSARTLVSHLAQRACPWPDCAGAGFLLLAGCNPALETVGCIASVLWLTVRAVWAWRSAARLLPVPAAVEVGECLEASATGK